MPRISKEESEARRTEIIDACEALYATESYHDITMTQVASKVSFGRANVYNYFQSKEEILLALLQREHELWMQDLLVLDRDEDLVSNKQIAQALGASLAKRSQMLKLLAMNLYDMEHNSRIENLVEFKQVYARLLQALRGLSASKKPGWNSAQIDQCIYCFLSFLHGVYPYVFHSEKQLAAMKEAGIQPPDITIESLVCACVEKLLQVD